MDLLQNTFADIASVRKLRSKKLKVASILQARILNINRSLIEMICEQFEVFSILQRKLSGQLKEVIKSIVNFCHKLLIVVDVLDSH